MSRVTKNSEIRLLSFGTVTKLIFEAGGYAEILMTGPELSRILDAWRTYEREKTKPDEKVIAALDLLCRKARGSFGAAIRAEVPIAQRSARIRPEL